MRPRRWDEEFVAAVLEELQDGEDVTVLVRSGADRDSLIAALGAAGADEDDLQHLRTRYEGGSE